MPKSSRKDAIIKIIEEKVIKTQTQLVNELNKLGYDVTQATVSRDINELGLRKSPDSQNRSRYRYPLSIKHNIESKYYNLFRESVINIESANNLVVLKTLEGSANSAAGMIDTMEIKNIHILGSIAGDDTVLIICKATYDAEILCATLKEFIL